MCASCSQILHLSSHSAVTDYGKAGTKMALGSAKAFALCKDSSEIFPLCEFSSRYYRARKTEVGKPDKTTV